MLAGMSSQLTRGVLPGDIAYTVLTPAAAGPPLPLTLVLHGAGSSSEFLATVQPLVDGMWADGSLPPAVLACASTPTAGGFYLGRWERLIADDFPAMLAAEHGADPERISLIGASMGGYGALKIAFAEPARWQAVAAIAPALLPADLRPRNTVGVLAELGQEMTAAGFAESSVLGRLQANADAIRASGLPIFLRVGDSDVFNLHDGTEQLHRALWDLDIGHEYHLVHGGDHLGPEAMAAQRAALAFAGAAGSAPGDDELAAEWRAWTDNARKGTPPRLDAEGASATVALRVMLELELAEAVSQDPTTDRRYGEI
jgi:S-formylglutathione hydrolase